MAYKAKTQSAIPSGERAAFAAAKGTSPTPFRDSGNGSIFFWLSFLLKVEKYKKQTAIRGEIFIFFFFFFFFLI